MDYKSAQEYWDIKDQESKKAPIEEVLTFYDKFLSTHNTLALATASKSYLDCTPLEYNFLDSYIYIFTEGGHKFYGLEATDRVALAVFENYKGFQDIQSIQIQGTCEIVEPYSKEYLKLLAYKRIPVEAMKKMNMHLLKITPRTVELLSTDFKKAGYSNRQHLDFD